MIKPLMLCTFITIASTTRSHKPVIINGSHLRSLSCLGMNATEEPCRVLGRVVSVPERLLNIYRNENAEVKDALNSGDLTTLNLEELNSIHPVLLLLIPSAELSWVGGEKLALLLKHWSKEKTIARHIISAVAVSTSKEMFMKKIQNVELPDDVLDMIGEHLSVEWSSREQRLLLPRIPFIRLFNLTSEKKEKMKLYLKSSLSSERSEWNNRKRSVLRTWARLLIEANYPKPLNQWSDSQIEMFGDVLVGATPSELNQINSYNVANKIIFFNYKFTSLQVRTLFTKFFNDSELKRKDFNELKHILHKLLPSQLQKFSNKATNYRDVKFYISSKSIASSNQMFQYLLMEGSNNRYHHLSYPVKEDSLKNFGYMVYLIHLSMLKTYMEKPLNIQQLMHLQSEYLTPTQVYYLTSKGKEISTSNNEIKQCFTLLHALPTSNINETLDPAIISHLALHLPTNNLPRLMKFIFNSHFTDNQDVIIGLLKEPSRFKMFGHLPVRIFAKHIERLAAFFSSLSNEFHPAWINLPNNLALPLYQNIKLRADKFLAVSDSLLNNLVYGFTCQEIIALPTSDFIVTISRFRKLINQQHREFPKDLQQCWAEKLVEYLKLKSHFTQLYINESLINLLTPVEIEAVGGWILIKLSVDDMKSSEYMVDIVRQIGALSPPEILVASDISKSREIIKAFLQDKRNKMGIEELYILGNLIMVFSEELIAKINPKLLRFLLEGDVLDLRLCATDAERNGWNTLILQAFGSPSKWSGEELELLGDMLIALPKDTLNEIRYDAWITVADILDSKYYQPIQWYREAKFYQVCQASLPQSEGEGYVKSIKTLITFYLRAAQMQLDSVKFAQDLQHEYEEPSALLVQEKESNGFREKGTIEEQKVSSHLSSDSDETDALNDDNELNQSVQISQYDKFVGKKNISSQKSDDIIGEPKFPDYNNQESSGLISHLVTSAANYSYETFRARLDNGNNAFFSTTPSFISFIKDDSLESDQSSLESDSEGMLEEYSNDATEKSAVLDSDAYDSDTHSTRFGSKPGVSLADNTNVSSDFHQDDVTQSDFVPQNTQNNGNKTNNLSIDEWNSNNTKVSHALIIANNTSKVFASNETKNKPTINLDSAHVADFIKNENEDANNFASGLINISDSPKLKEEYEFSQEVDILEPVQGDDENKVKSDMFLNDTNSSGENIPTTDINRVNKEFISTDAKASNVEAKEETGKRIHPNLASALQAFFNQAESTYNEEPLLEDILIPADEFINDVNKIRKRSLSIRARARMISCDAIRTIGMPAELVITQDIIEYMSDNELEDCTEYFATMDLADDIKYSIWNRIDKNDLHLKGKLLGAVKIQDLSDSAVNMMVPWAHENIYALSRFNSYSAVAEYIMERAINQSTALQSEELIAFGKMLCHLPNLKEMINPLFFFKSSVILGSSLPCNQSCLAIFISIAADEKAYGDPLGWSTTDVNDLGIVIGGLSTNEWMNLVKNNPNVLFGLKGNAGSCLSEGHIKVIPSTDILKIPYFTRLLINQQLKSDLITQEQKNALTFQPKIILNEFKPHGYSASSKQYLNSILSIILIIPYMYVN